MRRASVNISTCGKNCTLSDSFDIAVMRVFVLLAVIAAAAADSYTYHGRYGGSCGEDGVYYQDSANFVLCSGGNPYTQQCAPGTKNSGYGSFTYGNQYSLGAFCDINLLAASYNPVVKAYYGYNTGKLVYHGKYSDKCDQDGLYYRDFSSYVICTNGNAYVQKCAEGTRNSGVASYSYGGYYSYADFCDVNLVDFGYSARRAVFSHPYRYGYRFGYY